MTLASWKPSSMRTMTGMIEADQASGCLHVLQSVSISV